MTPGLVIDLGSTTVAAVAVTEQGAWLMPDPTSGESRWRCAMHWDGERVVVGALAEHRRREDPGGYAAGFKRALDLDTPAVLGARQFRPVDQVAELLAVIRAQAQRHHGPIDRAVITIPTDYGPGDQRRHRLVAAAEAAGFAAVELLAEAVAAVSAPLPGPPFGVGDLVLVYDLGATFTGTLVRIGGEHHEIVTHVADPSPTVDQTIAACQELVARVGFSPSVILPVGGGCRLPGVEVAVHTGLGRPIRRAEEPELVVVRGGAHWLPRNGPRTVVAQPAEDRLVPLSFTIPGGSARLVRWLVSPHQSYDEGASLARVRLPDGALWDLTARCPGTVDQLLVADGSCVSTGEWLALTSPR